MIGLESDKKRSPKFCVNANKLYPNCYCFILVLKYFGKGNQSKSNELRESLLWNCWYFVAVQEVGIRRRPAGLWNQRQRLVASIALVAGSRGLHVVPGSLPLWLESSLWPQQPIDGGSPTQKWPQCNCCAPCRGVGPHPSKLSFDLIKSFTFVFERSFSFAQATPSSFCSEQRVDKKVTTKRS